MTIPAPTFTDRGFIPPSEADEVLPAVLAEMDSAFGGGLNLALDTPQGQLASSETAAIGNANDSFCALANGVDPAYASGRMQDAIARIYFLERKPALPTVVEATCLGAAGVVIPEGSRAVATDGNIYVSLGDATIPEGGSVLISFACSVPGPIACAAGSLNTIYQVINGWDSIINAADGAIGRNTETRAEFERRRRLSVAQNAQGSLPSVLGAVLSVPGVLDAYVIENVNNTSLEVRGFTLAPNSLYVAAVGGTDADVARAIWTKKSPGCGYNGNTSVTVYDDNPAYNPPVPSYEVKFERPAPVTIIFLVSLMNNAGIPANAVTLIQNAIVAAFAGEDGGARANIGGTIFASRFYAPVVLLGSWAQIVTIKIGCSNAPAAAFNASIAGDVLSVSSISSGIITIGQLVIGDGVVPGTQIIGGAYPTFTLNTVQTVASSDMVGIVATNDEVQVDIDQQPVTAQGNIALVLL